MAEENTFIMLKPDCMKRGLVGEIITRIERKGYRIVDAKMMKLSASFLYEHYAHLADQPFFPLILNHMLSGPVFGMIVRGENAVLGMRHLVGATKFEDAQPGSIRGDYALSTVNNLIHCSDSVETGETEIKRFFGTGAPA
ncbi:nucleoside diphosphate kinase [Sporobacter termitidis DSM 10068]|uniref:Nucleoside diphosphate kinase n=1 Tax=Sporobacter termitidis DSM 10068 TaxID=1123282 RepID=A0A1M5YYN6_9FIRM|nr:nucleoside-diphosphate kinase [Sporobacter termitidis]SHI16938.1 nucleoside diphosphate kinase [Sporobacter termitidis DSM 10068]